MPMDGLGPNPRYCQAGGQKQSICLRRGSYYRAKDAAKTKTEELVAAK
jgi:hypothetical protein